MHFISAFSQQQILPLNREYNLNTERILNRRDNPAHTSFKPYISSAINYDSLEVSDSARQQPRAYTTLTGRKIKSESLFIVKQHEDGRESFLLRIDPLFNFSYSTDLADTSPRADTVTFYNNTRGILVRADIGTKVSFSSSFLENQSFFPYYIDEFVKAVRIVPGNGRVKPFKKSGYDYAMASGFVSFSPLANLNIQLGHDKNFIGDGYRSLLLSDNAFNYPFLKITSYFWKRRIQYTNLFAQLSSLERIPFSTTPEALFKPKAGSFHFINFIPCKYVHIGFFEGIIWERWNSAGARPFDWNFVNPLIFANTAIQGFSGRNNPVMGANLKIKILDGLAIYVQHFYNGTNKYGYQAGLKAFDLFTIKNLVLQAEYNSIQEQSYDQTESLSDYVHYNQPLTHPYYNGFDEIISILNYRWKDFRAQGKVIYARRYNSFFYSKNIADLLFNEIEISYLINRQTNMNIYCGLLERTEETVRTGSALNHKTQLIYFGIRTNLSNQYVDF